MRNEIRCPECRSENISDILWGIPVCDEKLEHDIEEGRIVLGGCCITDADSDWHCTDCGCEFDTLGAALWCIWNTDSNRDCVFAAVNLGDDADNTVCAAGALARAMYRYDCISEEWIEALRRNKLTSQESKRRRLPLKKPYSHMFWIIGIRCLS